MIAAHVNAIGTMIAVATALVLAAAAANAAPDTRPVVDMVSPETLTTTPAPTPVPVPDPAVLARQHVQMRQEATRQHVQAVLAARAAAAKKRAEAAKQEAQKRQAQAEKERREKATARSTTSRAASQKKAATEAALAAAIIDTAPTKEQTANMSAAQARAYASGLVKKRGWPATEFACLDAIFTQESGWDATATNKSSGAYGIPQALPGTKMASTGSDWRTNPRTQIEWGITYVKARYGTPCKAWSFKQVKGWY